MLAIWTFIIHCFIDQLAPCIDSYQFLPFALSSTSCSSSSSSSSNPGSTPLPPSFAIAYHQCRWNYNDQDDVLNVNSNFDKFDIPVDVIWLDIEHTDGKRYFTWDKQKFPDSIDMINQVAAKVSRDAFVCLFEYFSRRSNILGLTPMLSLSNPSSMNFGVFTLVVSLKESQTCFRDGKW